VQPAGVEESGDESAVDAPRGDHATTGPASREGSLPEGADLSEREVLLARVDRLEAELERYRAQAERTSKLLVSATNYAEWVRERARRDAELALRKATARMEKLTVATRELEQTQHELVRLKDELVRLQALTDETRARLSAFLTAGLQVLNAEVETGRAIGPERAPANLDDMLRRQLPSALFGQHRHVPSTSAPEPVPREEVEPQEEH
jgi:DivIVA protein